MSEKEKARLRIEQYKQRLKAGNQTPRNKQALDIDERIPNCYYLGYRDELR
jgi:hypothetical protein